jgi:hypothetical protein
MTRATDRFQMWRSAFPVLLALAIFSGQALCGQPKPPRDSEELQPEDPQHKSVVVQGSGKTLRILKIGNSFSQNATEYLSQIAAAQGNAIVWGRAEIGGCSLQKHWELAALHDSKPDDPAGLAYSGNMINGKSVKASLQELLQSQPWDIVTLQQHSFTAPDIKTYRPYVNQLADYVRKYAPKAKIWLHETWAYRADDKLFKQGGMTQEKMYQSIHETYATIATEIQAEKVIPCATAFQNARKDSRWQLEVENVDLKKLKYPNLPHQSHALCVGYKWDTKVNPPKLSFDPKHCTPAGKYLAALVWNETFFGPSTKVAWAPDKFPASDAEFLQEIARKTVRDGLKP